MCPLFLKQRKTNVMCLSDKKQHAVPSNYQGPAPTTAALLGMTSLIYNPDPILTTNPICMCLFSKEWY